MAMTKWADITTKRNIITSIAKANPNFAGYFSDCAFSKAPITNEPQGITVWTAQRGDVTALVWERGTNVDDWIAKFVTW